MLRLWRIKPTNICRPIGIETCHVKPCAGIKLHCIPNGLYPNMNIEDKGRSTSAHTSPGTKHLLPQFCWGLWNFKTPLLSGKGSPDALQRSTSGTLCGVNITESSIIACFNTKAAGKPCDKEVSTGSIDSKQKIIRSCQRKRILRLSTIDNTTR